MQLITRADDAGSSHSANRAIYQCATEGFIRNVSLMAPGAAIENAAETLKSLSHIDFGLHCVLNSEWDSPRWGPVLPIEKVPLLIESDGCFTHTPNDLFNRGVNEDLLHQCEREIRAQLRRLRDLGFHIRYIDEHMGVLGVLGLRARLEVLATEEQLVYRPDCTAIWIENTQAENVQNALQNASASTCVFITHPTFDDEETRAIRGMNTTAGQIARDRNKDREMCLNPQISGWCAANNINFVRYSEAFANG